MTTPSSPPPPASSRRPLSSRDTRWARALTSLLVARRVTPNTISVAGMVFATLGALAYRAPEVLHFRPLFWLLAAGAIQLRLLCNLLDGLVAVEGGLKGRAGDLFNEAPDRYADLVLLVGAGFATGDVTLGWVAAAGAILTAYVRALGASFGRGQDFCGPLAKQQRMFFLTVGSVAGAFYAPVLHWALWWIALGTYVTVMRRVLRLYEKMPAPPAS